MHQHAGGGAARHKAPAMEINVPHNPPELRLPVKDGSLQAGSLEAWNLSLRTGKCFQADLPDVPSADAPGSLRSEPGERLSGRRERTPSPVDLTASLIAQLWNLPIFYFYHFFQGGWF